MPFARAPLSTGRRTGHYEKRRKFRAPSAADGGHERDGNVEARNEDSGEDDNGGPNFDLDDVLHEAEAKFADFERLDILDQQMGFARLPLGLSRHGWLINVKPTLVKDEEWLTGRAGLDLYFLEDDGQCFKATLLYSPYFYVKSARGKEADLEDFLRRRFENTIERLERCGKEDLDMANHLASKAKAPYVKLTFRNMQDLNKVKGVLQPWLDKLRRLKAQGQQLLGEDDSGGLASVVEMREHDVPYHPRVLIDSGLRVGLWYDVQPVQGGRSVNLRPIKDRQVRPDPVVLAFDLETSKQPLKFPDPAADPIMMVSYMVDGRGYLITNRDIISADIADFEYSPVVEYPGRFRVFNEPSEQALLTRFVTHVQMLRPQIIVTYNGDNFDWEYLQRRCLVHGMRLHEMLGFRGDRSSSRGTQTAEWTSRHCVHMDCFCWVKRDSYLPAGSQGLKAVAHAKLGYDPLELDPEEMTPLALEDPQTLANYSVSDAVATYYLYMKYVHPFIFSLCTLIPMSPDEVLRKGSGTLCEMLLMAQAFHANIIFPNKHVEEPERYHRGRLLKSETYVGGHVEALEAGVFRADFEYKFHGDPQTLDRLLRDLDSALHFFLTSEKCPIEEVVNLAAVQGDIVQRLQSLRGPTVSRPLIYHLDVGAMYPNIILTNRLQPPAMVSESVCARCDYADVPECKRPMTWQWRGDYYSATKSEVSMLRGQLERERFDLAHHPGVKVSFGELPERTQQALMEQRLKDYSRKVYRRTHASETVERTSIICQRENAFYIDTVRSFRDHRYTYKALCKVWKRKLDEAERRGEAAAVAEAEKMHVAYDSLQLAHKVILNSFYGYVMRKGSRWYSMEMGGIVCHAGARIISMARDLVDKVGRPLELDTDGIWCMLPAAFPQNYVLKTLSGRTLAVSYPCLVLNHLIAVHFSNDQYATLQADGSYTTSAENSIFFEIDGPYHGMVLPSSLVEGEQLKKRYVVFKADGSIAELKGFELKRRGELKLVKVFQTELFQTFLKGGTLSECYGAVARLAKHWLRILQGRGATLSDADLFDLLAENKSMSKGLEEYANQRSPAITTARRLAECLGEEVITGSKGSLSCRYVVSARPLGAPVAARAIPVAVFALPDEGAKLRYLRRWLHDPTLSAVDLRALLDWQYYFERLQGHLQKLIVIPAISQGLSNPLPAVHLPDWVRKKVSFTASKGRQSTLGHFVSAVAVGHDEQAKSTGDIEDRFGGPMLFGDAQASSAIAANEVIEEIIEERPEGEVPDLDGHFVDWILYHRRWVWPQLWASQSRPVDKGDGPKVEIEGQEGNSNGSTNIKDNDLHLPWHIVTMHQSAPGLFDFWICDGLGQWQRLLGVQVDRRLYVHTRQPIDAQTTATTTMNLPVSHCRLLTSPQTTSVDGKSGLLYQVDVVERIFQQSRSAMDAAFCHPNVLGVYEAADLDIQEQLLAALTSVVVKPSPAFCKDPSVLAGREDWEPVPFAQTYLAQSPIRYCLLYGYASALPDQRAVYALFSEDNRIVQVAIVDPAMLRQTGNVQGLYDRGRPPGALFAHDRCPEFTVSLHLTRQSALSSIQLSPKAIVLIAGNQDIVLEDHACIQLGPGNVDVFPPLDWQRYILRRALDFFYGIDGLLAERLHWSRHAQIPLGCLAPLSDVVAFVADSFWMRMLKLHGYVVPGREAAQAELVPAIIERPGSAPNGAVEILVQDLVVNAVLCLGELSPTEARTTVDRLTSPTPQHPAINLLRSLVDGWTKSRAQGSPQAEQLLAHFPRWLSTTSLVPPWLRDQVMAVASVCLDRLVDALGELGLSVLHADHQRILVALEQPNAGHVGHLLEHLLRKDPRHQRAFSHLTLLPLRKWRVLLFLSWHDYCGFAYSPSESHSTAAHKTENADKAVQGQPAVALQFDEQSALREYLPECVKRPYSKVLQQFLSALLQRHDPDDKENEESPLLSMGVRDLFLRIVKAVRKLTTGPPQNDGELQQRQFPLMDDNLRTYRPTDVAIELVRFTVRMLSLHDDLAGKRLADEAYAAVGRSGFSPDLAFQYPGVQLELRMHCSGCGCLAPINGLSGLAAECIYCGEAINAQSVNAHLVMLVERIARHLQSSSDLVCSRCKKPQATLLASECPECGSLARLVRSPINPDTRRLLLLLPELTDDHALKTRAAHVLQFVS